ncbi:MAG: hypothetical protein GY842_13965 [bacterium]|nr:hypothetical protein [bacterium]
MDKNKTHHDTEQRDQPSPQMACPACQGKSIARIRRSEYPEGEFMILAPSRCRDCGELFATPCGTALCVLTVLIGLGSAVVICVSYVVPCLTQLIDGKVSVVSVLEAVAGLFACTFSLAVILLGARTAAYSTAFRSGRLSDGRTTTSSEQAR